MSWEEGFRDSPHHRFLGLEFELRDDGSAEVRMPFRDELVSDPDVPYLHGGVLASLLDTAADYAVAAQLGRGVPTIDMRIDFLRTAGRESLVATGRVVKLGRSVAVADAEIRNEDGELVALGRILFSTR
jgi:uncharacterized protein (TIGR00369 family)